MLASAGQALFYSVLFLFLLVIEHPEHRLDRRVLVRVARSHLLSESLDYPMLFCITEPAIDWVIFLLSLFGGYTRE